MATKSEETTKTSSKKYFYANGKRKTAVARVKLFKGTGKITINDKDAKEYLPLKILIEKIKSPFILTGNTDKFDVVARVEGGGINAQADAVRHGISKGLVVSNADFKTTLKKAGLITRDSRVKERKKYGLKRARKAPQFSKR